jgi:imidazole glycerol-phosphate synthase subunit HisH
MLVIVDYGMGNTGSIRNMLKRIGVPARLGREPAAIAEADRLILPGVGAFDSAVQQIRALGLWEVLEDAAARRGVPILGICLGMQLLTEGSDEGSQPGFGWIRGRCVRFDPAARPGLKVPHMGWSTVRIERPTPLSAGVDDTTRYYFVHSYFVRAEDPADVALTTEHGERFASAVQRRNVHGVQFHPEKSHRYGMQVLRNFARVDR